MSSYSQAKQIEENYWGRRRQSFETVIDCKNISYLDDKTIITLDTIWLRGQPFMRGVIFTVGSFYSDDYDGFDMISERCPKH